jgi:hypothetical protein
MTDPTTTDDPAMGRLTAAIDAARPWLGGVPPSSIGQELACAYLAAPQSWLAQFSASERQEMTDWAQCALERAAELVLLASLSGADDEVVDCIAIPIQ